MVGFRHNSDNESLSKVQIVNRSIRCTCYTFVVQIIHSQGYNWWISLQYLNLFAVLRKHLVVSCRVLSDGSSWASNHNRLIIALNVTYFSTDTPFLDSVVHKLIGLLVISCHWSIRCCKHDEVGVVRCSEELSEADSCEIWSLEVLRHILNIVSLQLLILQVKSPERENALISNGTELNVSIINVRVYFHLVDCIMSD